MCRYITVEQLRKLTEQGYHPRLAIVDSLLAKGEVGEAKLYVNQHFLRENPVVAFIALERVKEAALAQGKPWWAEQAAYDQERLLEAIVVNQPPTPLFGTADVSGSRTVSRPGGVIVNGKEGQ